MDTGFDLGRLLGERAGEGHRLQGRMLNPQLPRMLHAIGFDRTYTRAEGAYLYDAEGNDYLDFLAGFGVHGVGHNHPVVRSALHQVLDADLADMVQFDSPLLAGLLAEKLLARAPHLDRVYFGNSGTEAVEAAIKFARYATGRPRILYCDHAFHGLTTGSLSVNGAAEFRDGFEPLLPDTRIPLGDLDALEAELRRGGVAALLIEPIQGKGVHQPPAGFLRAAHDLLKDHGALLICDEVQTGVGRTGRFFAYEYDDVQPDIVTVAKALSGGFVPVGATLAKDWIFEKVYSSMDRVLVHDSTFGSNAMAMAAGLATLQVMEDEKLVENAERIGTLLREQLAERLERYEMLAEVRGRGLMIGFEFGKPRSLKLKAGWNTLQAARKGLFAQMVVVPLFQRHRILTQVSGDHIDVIKLLPPLTIGEVEVERFLAAFDDVMRDAHKGTGLMWDFGRTLVTQAVRRG
ncbi:aspartate aminotransferase family protein [Actinospica durhamensis]|uniref:Aspartate aminotransferase family protein n=1 Tax=Actinospica durhamensis TaxID=1508375 RepID=A0A941INI1_9ACTN|nr:aspartate aminotransferase family protein [Actinospica durhamensis]MBR7833999.1 aspartate aminotransferase family protein [Actinospica durhamensis]